MVHVLCVGQNYARHAAELGSTTPEQPIWFWKPEASIIGDGEPVRVPTDRGAIHHEVELAVRIGHDGGPDAFTVAVDVTARDLQNEAKARGRPWAQAKGYDSFCPLGAWVPSGSVDLQDLRLRLSVDGGPRQDGWTGDMTWPVAQLLRHAAQWTTLRPGDIMLTGTPHGVGPITPGQEMRAEVVGHASIRNQIEAR